jgi:anti-sigma factor RsiW
MTMRPIPELACDEVRDLAPAFVLGALEDDEMAAVRAHLATCPEAHAEMAELGGVVPHLAESLEPVEPTAGLKSRIVAAVEADLAARGGTAPIAPPIAFPTASERAAQRSRPSTGTWILRIAAVLAIVALGGWNLLLRGQLDGAQAYQQSVAEVLDVAAQPGSLTAILSADGGTGSGLAAVSAAGQATLAMQDLAATAGSSVYEAWVIAGDGVPVPLGSFTVGRDGTGTLQASGLPTEAGIVLALTLEPGPGATTPTMPIISRGVAGAPPA